MIAALLTAVYATSAKSHCRPQRLPVQAKAVAANGSTEELAPSKDRPIEMLTVPGSAKPPGGRGPGWIPEPLPRLYWADMDSPSQAAHQQAPDPEPDLALARS